jgi:pimeloyl-[acyl-carrier protein] methyl ester esterase
MIALVLVHGWGVGPAVFRELKSRLTPDHEVHALPLSGYDGSLPCEPYDLESLARGLAAAAPERCLVAGWSLGAQVALAWARAAPRQVERLALISATPWFVQREDWGAGMQKRVLEEFAAGLERDVSGTLRRFASLQAQGDDAAKQVALALRACIAGGPAIETQTLRRGLDLLMGTDLRGALPGITHDALVVHGENDTLVPLPAAQYLADTLPHGTLAAVRGAAHAPFVSHADAVARALQAFFV